MSMQQVSRRGFVRGAGLAVGAAAATAVARSAVAATPVDPADVVWDRECDVVVCGAGGGLLAACDAADAGNEVVVLEKAGWVGGESAMNEGWINGAGSQVQSAEGVEDNGELAMADYLANHAGHNVDHELLADYTAHSGANIDRLVELGCEYVLAQDTAFFTSVPRAHILQPNASAWGTVLGKAAEERGVQILLETPLTGLVVDSDGQVVGVKAGDLFVKARKGVILATGDVSNNERIKHKFQPDWAHIPSYCETNTGDGLYAALAVGADSSFDQFTTVGPSLSYYPTGSVVSFYQVLKGMIMVNKAGKRFANEDDNTTTAGLQYDQPEGEAWSVFDSRVAAMSHRPDCPVAEISGRVFGGECAELGLISGVGPAYLEDYEELGCVVQADSIAELAELCEIDATGLAEQVEAWNAAVKAGVDEEFGRSMAGAMQFGEMVAIEEGPFYAMKMARPRWTCAEGPNLMVNTAMSVLDPAGEPIARLYACGAGIMAGTVTLYANTCGDHMGITAWSARRAAESVDALEPMA